VLRHLSSIRRGDETSPARNGRRVDRDARVSRQLARETARGQAGLISGSARHCRSRTALVFPGLLSHFRGSDTLISHRLWMVRELYPG